MADSRELLDDIRALARPLRGDADLDQLVERARTRRFVAIGEASHGTHEYYELRCRLSRRLIEEQGIAWIGVEGDWPDCWRIDRWVRGISDQELDARALLAGFERWPTWLWANAEVADFLDWLHGWNLQHPPAGRTGFYGLDVYSLWDSLHRVIGWLDEHAPEAVPQALKAWQCFAPFGEDPQRYAWGTRLVPVSCEREVVDLLAGVRALTVFDGDDAFDASQNAAIAAGAEHYYRAMVRTDRGSWNIRDIHMADTIDRISERFGPTARGLIWEHNTHVGDARATSMAAQGLVNVGQLLRERHGDEGVLLVGFAGYRGTVIAGTQWGSTEQVMALPVARSGSHEHLMHAALGVSSVLDFSAGRRLPWLSLQAGHRAVGVVYDPDRESGNYVPTNMGDRYDALIWIEETSALHPLGHERMPAEAEFETEPTGF